LVVVIRSAAPFLIMVDESRVKTLSAILYLVLTSARNLICAKGPD
jgi:hypothetical protein